MSDPQTCIKCGELSREFHMCNFTLDDDSESLYTNVCLRCWGDLQAKFKTFKDEWLKEEA